jgi:nucleotide-binding universal stress UspA family protein
MEKKLLIAVDDSRHSENALRYAAGIYATVSDLKYVLLHVQPTVSQYLLDEAKTRPKAYAELEKMMQKNSAAAHRLLETCKERMVSMGISDGDIQLVSLPRQLGTAKDILDYSTEGLYDALLMGRRGLSSVAEVFAGSVSSTIVDYSNQTPIWLVEEKGPSNSFMIAADGSESSLRAVDHLAFMLSGNTDVSLSFYHVAPRLQDFCPIDFEESAAEELEAIIRLGDKACIDRFFSHAQQKFKEAGLRENQINVSVKQGVLRVGKAVLDAYRQGNFGTLVVGRRGMDKKFFTGSVSRYLINQFSGGALWVVP